MGQYPCKASNPARHKLTNASASSKLTSPPASREKLPLARMRAFVLSELCNETIMEHLCAVPKQSGATPSRQLYPRCRAMGKKSLIIYIACFHGCARRVNLQLLPNTYGEPGMN